jgi:hypothetical protein
MAEIRAEDNVTVSGDRFTVRRRMDDPSHHLRGWYECIQETGHPAVIGTIQYLSPSMIATGDHART